MLYICYIHTDSIYIYMLYIYIYIFYIYIYIYIYYIYTIYSIGWFVGFLWHINLCRLFSGQIHFHITNKFYFKTIQFSITTELVKIISISKLFNSFKWLYNNSV